LIIDDDRDNRELLAEVLELAGYPVAACGTAADADRILDARGRPAVVVSDVRLPDMHGPTFVGKMKRRPGFEDTPVIFVTGLHASASVLESVADPILLKPFDMDVLMSLVSRYCDPMATASGQPG
jgi:CheY-like chemotaxis protein